MNNVKYNTVGTVLKSYRKIIESEAKSIPENMAAHIHHSLVQELQ